MDFVVTEKGLKERFNPIGLVVGTGMQNFLPKYAKGEWKAYRDSIGEREFSVEIYKGSISYPAGMIELDIPIVAVSRHGRDPNKLIKPHEIDYAANMIALYENGVRKVFATSAVGVGDKRYVGKLIVPDDLDDVSGRLHDLPPEMGMTGGSECKYANILGRPEGEGGDRKVLEKMKYAIVGLGTNPCAHLSSGIVHEEHIEKVKQMENDLVELLKKAIPKAYSLESNKIVEE